MSDVVYLNFIGLVVACSKSIEIETDFTKIERNNE